MPSDKFAAISWQE